MYIIRGNLELSVLSRGGRARIIVEWVKPCIVPFMTMTNSAIESETRPIIGSFR